MTLRREDQPSTSNVINTLSPQPLYQQLKQILERQIVSGQLEPGNPIPSERELCEQYGISSTTARRALHELVSEGLILRRPGVGSFVSSSPRSLNLLLLIMGFHETEWRQHAYLFGDLIGGIARVAWERHAVFSVMDVPKDSRDIRSVIYSAIQEGMFDGILLRIAGDLHDDYLMPFLETDFPYVVIKRYLPGRIINSVVVDDVEGGYQVTERLIRLGHRRIGFIAPQGIVVGRDRCEGYYRALDAAGLPRNECLVSSTEDFLQESGYQATGKLLTLQDRPTAVFVPSDMLSIGAYRAIKEAGLRIPEDIAVVGYDDIPLAATLSPPLATVSTPYYEFGIQAASLLLDIITQKVKPPKRVEINQEFVPRESIGQHLGPS